MITFSTEILCINLLNASRKTKHSNHYRRNSHCYWTQPGYSCFQTINLFNIKHMYQNDIKIVNFTATPDNIANDLFLETGCQNFHHATTKNYTSIFELLDKTESDKQGFVWI